jgi:hypothetical protein
VEGAGRRGDGGGAEVRILPIVGAGSAGWDDARVAIQGQLRLTGMGWRGGAHRRTRLVVWENEAGGWIWRVRRAIERRGFFMRRLSRLRADGKRLSRAHAGQDQGQGYGSSSTRPSAWRITRPQAREVWPEGNRSARISVGVGWIVMRLRRPINS